jgi:hypothetical protein
MTTFCAVCGGGGFCLPGCTVSSPRQQYYQRQRWQAAFMLALATGPESREYWTGEVAKADAALDERVELAKAA